MRKWTLKFLLGLCGLLAMPTGSAQTWEIFDMNTAGLPNNTVKALAVAPNADVWVGTEFGLCRYDGSTWQTFQTGSSGLPDNDVRSLAVDDGGAVWIGTLGGLARYDAGTWDVYTSGNSTLPENYVRSLAIAPQGGVWVGTVGGLSWFDGDTTWHHYNNTPGSYNGLQLPGINIAALRARADGALCVGTVNAGFTYLTDTSVTVYTTFSNGLPDNTALGIALDSQGARWLACPAGALLNHAGALVGGAWVQFSTLNSMLPSNALTCIAIDGWDRKLIGNQISGFTIFQGFGSFTTYTMQNSDLPGDEILSLALDGTGSVWIGTSSGGAARFGYAVGLAEEEESDGLVVFPNPVTDELRFIAPDPAQEGTYRLLDITGRVLSSGRSMASPNVVDMRSASSGPYILEVLDREGRRLASRRILRL